MSFFFIVCNIRLTAFRVLNPHQYYFTVILSEAETKVFSCALKIETASLLLLA